MVETGASLVDALRSVWPSHEFSEAVASGVGASADVPLDTAIVVDDDAVIVQATLHGPGDANARMLDVDLLLDDVVLHTMRGGRFEAVYPPQAFAPVLRSVHPRLPFPWPEKHGTIEFGALDGRSSDGDMPFFLLTNLEGTAGMWIAVGWSGQWRARLTKVQREGRHRLSVEGPGTSVALERGESLALPSVTIGLFEGDGWDAIRRYLSRRAPRATVPWVVYNTWFNEEGRITEDRLLAHVPVAAAIGVEVFCVDATWYETDPSDPNDFRSRGVGTWSCDVRKFPQGLEHLAAAVRDAGMVFGLWYEPERAHPDSAVWQQHPEWIRTVPDDPLGLVDFGTPDARRWIVDLLSDAITRCGIGWIKWDMNIHAVLPYWAGDERAEIAHVRGVWEVMDALRHRFPDLVIEGCASGGNRIDAEMLARCDTYWISDQTISPDIVRATVAQARRVLPAQYCYLSIAPQLDESRGTFPDEWFVAAMNGVFGIMERLSEWPKSLREQAARHVATFKQLRHLLDGEYLWLRSEELFGWEACELSDPVTGEAALLALRLRSHESTHTFVGAHTWTLELPEGGSAVVRRGPDASA